VLDVAIAGGGLSGLALARALHAEGGSFGLFEARDRLGGRVLSVRADGAARLDLGAGWFWPQSHPRVAALIGQMGLESFEQYDRGTLLSLADPEKPATEARLENVHSGARRISGGMAGLTESIAASLPPWSIHLQHVLRRVTRRDDHVELQLHHGGETIVVQARRMVLAMPPRLIAEQVTFDPPLSEQQRTALAATPTWMATSAKVAIRYEQASWRSRGRSGSAFVHHPQAVLGEIFDACDATGLQAALGGFVALSPQLRQDFRAGLPMLISNQVEQVFGAQAGECGQSLQDWALDPFTCSRQDLSDCEAGTVPTDQGLPLLRLPQWQGRLYFGGSEMAEVAGGYLEGALGSAERIHGALQAHSAKSPAERATARPAAAEIFLDMTLPTPPSRNGASLARFAQWVASQQEPTFDLYRRYLNSSLALQQYDQLTQRAVLQAMEEVFHSAVEKLQELPFDSREVCVEHGRSALTPQVQVAFHGFIDRLLSQIARFNRSSCALANFPHEHNIAADYRGTMLRDIAAAWREFCLDANAVLLGRSVRRTPVPPTQSLGITP
jgi:monoamine oxidase